MYSVLLDVNVLRYCSQASQSYLEPQNPGSVGKSVTKDLELNRDYKYAVFAAMIAAIFKRNTRSSSWSRFALALPSDHA